jgi:hypothetical protein
LNKKLAYESIGKMLGCSEVPVREACEKMNIPMIRLNASLPEVQAYLNDRDWLFDQHKNQRKTCKQIAEEIGSSSATIGVALAKHGIQANPPNSYDRVAAPSKGCLELAEYIKSLGFDCKLDDRQILNGREIDILIPSMNFGIEYNGIYSHLHRPEETNPALIKGPQYHISKKTDAAKQGIDLIHIFEDDWMSKKDIIKSMISSKLKKNQTIYARNCEFMEVPNWMKKEFLVRCHLQGKDFSTIWYGLQHDGELIALMTFGRSRYNKNYDFELMRFCCKPYVNVVGGFSRLLKKFRSEHSGSIISYADRNHSTGEVYEKNGFELKKINYPSYSYVDLNTMTRMHRAGLMKKKLLDGKLDDRPEWEIAREFGYGRLWECGTMTFVMDTNKKGAEAPFKQSS